MSEEKLISEEQAILDNLKEKICNGNLFCIITELVLADGHTNQADTLH